MIARLALLLAAAMLLPLQPPPPREALERAYRASNRGVASLEQYDYGEAAAFFREALRIAPRLAAARFNLAVALLYAGRADEARAEAEAAAAAMPGAPQPPFVLGLIARAGSRAADAEAAFRRVLEIDPADAAANVNLGQLLLQKREYGLAVTAFRAAVAAEPYNATAAYGLATALTRAGSAAEGQQQMTRFQELRDSAYAVTYTQGYLEQGRYAEAITSTGAEPELVDRAPPAVGFVETSDVFAPGAASGGGAASLFDVDADGDLDVLTGGPAGSRLLFSDAGRFSAGPPLPVRDAATIRGAFGDFDNDSRVDILLVAAEGSRLLRQRPDGTFEDVTQSAKLPAGFAPGAIAWVDVDHDGDLDLVSAAPLRLLRNDGNGSFTDRTAAAGLAAADAAPRTDAVTRVAAVVPTDYDNRRDVDLLILQGGMRPLLFRNLRDGTFRESAVAIGLPMQDNVVAVAASDLNQDGFIDFFFARSGGPGVFALSDGREKFVRRDAPAATVGATRAQFFDYDNDGLVDLIACTPAGARLWRNTGADWSDETSRAGLAALGDSLADVVLGDVDRDGDTDVVASRQGTLRLWRNQGGNRRKSVTVALAPRVSNRSGFGARVEIRAGSLRQMFEWSSASPAVAPADLVFGLGARDTADVVRVLWPSGILQTEVAPAARARIEELDRKPSSCPYLYTWNGERFEFISDFLGGGEMGDWIAPGLFNTPDPDEYVRVEGRQLVARDGRYDVRITNELEEAMFLDRVRLLVVDHPAGVEVYPNEGLKDAPRPSFRLHATRGARVPLRAIDEHGHDVRALIAERDRRWPDDFARAAVRGYAVPHTLTLDLGADADRAVLLLTGWTGYAWSSDNVAAAQAGLPVQPPVLEVRDRQGAWTVVDRNIGFPVGRPQTVVVDMAGKWLGPSREVRIATTMQIFWDQVLVDTSGGSLPREIRTLDPATAQLRWRGFSAETSPDGREPFGADYTKVSAASPWKTIPGAYTREGDVGALLSASDDMFVIARPGDEIALSFDAAAAPALRHGWQRTFLIFADGYSKEMNIRSATPDVLGPLPFHGMSRYPYGSTEKYPTDAAHRDYRERYNTRIAPRAVPSLDASAASGNGDRRR